MVEPAEVGGVIVIDALAIEAFLLDFAVTIGVPTMLCLGSARKKLGATLPSAEMMLIVPLVEFPMFPLENPVAIVAFKGGLGLAPFPRVYDQMGSPLKFTALYLTVRKMSTQKNSIDLTECEIRLIL